MKKRVFGLLALAATTASASAQDVQVPLTELLDDWRSQHGDSWYVHASDTTGRFEMLYGGGAQPTFEPDTNVPGHWFELARHFVAETVSMHGIPDAQLVDEFTRFLPLGTANGTDKMTVRLSQEIGGVAVEGAKVNVLFNTEGVLCSIHSTAMPVEGTPTAVPAISDRVAERAALAAFQTAVGLPPTEVGVPTLSFARVDLGEAGIGPVLAWQVSVQRLIDDETPQGYLYTVDAATGAVVRTDDEIHYFDVFGNIATMASPGVLPDIASNPEQPLPAAHIRLQAGSQTVYADINGDFNFPGINSATNVTATYLGLFNNVNNNAGADYSITFNNVPANTQNNLVMNPTPTELTTGQSNAYLHIGTTRDFIKGINPADNTADFVATSNANQNSNCNAFFNGNSVNYFTSGGGCVNTAYSTVVAHEFGHWLNVLYGTGNGSDGMGEGNADVWAMYTWDSPIVGENFFTSGGFIRTGTNLRQYCGDNNGGCYGQVHADGEVWMGAAWKVRTELNNTLGNTLGDATSDNLFLGWMNGYNQSQIHSIIEIQWLTLDDNDNDINNGTPNYQDINDGFLIQGFPGFDLPFVVISNVTDLPNVIVDMGPYTVDATIQAQINPPVTNPTLAYRVNGGAFTNVAMVNTAGDNYQAQIPVIGQIGIVEYKVSASDGMANSNESNLFDFSIGQEIVALDFDFEAATNEGWSVGDTGDNATTGIWERVDPNPTAAQPGDDHTPFPGVICWVTGQQPPTGTLGTNDVDNGKTTLKTPIFDMSGLIGAKIEYWRWYSNNQGAAPNTDTFVIDISNNGGSTWTNVEIVGPGGNESNGGWFFHSFTVAGVIAPTANMQMRFVAADLGAGSIVEAAIDDVKGTGVVSGCPPPTTYCIAAPNSTGGGALIDTFGSQDVNANSFGLIVTGSPPGENGLFFYGMGQQQSPVGNGFLCIGGNFFRLPVVQADNLGVAAFNLDFNNLPAGGDIMNGDIVNCQYWYRDPGVGQNFNFSDGVEVEFCGN